MMKTWNLYLLVVLLAITGCKKEVETPKVIYEEPVPEKITEKQEEPDNNIEVADLPIQMDGTPYLIHAIGDSRLMNEGKSRGAYADRISFSVSNYNRFEITGYLRNLKFQHQDSIEIRTLTDKPVIIQTATYLENIATKLNKQLLVYTINDLDTNKDGKLNADDVKALYISKISGEKFVKLSPEKQELIDWNVNEKTSRLYFRTIEDTNRNGQFDKKDNLYYYYIDLKNDNWELNVYTPLQ